MPVMEVTFKVDAFKVDAFKAGFLQDCFCLSHTLALRGVVGMSGFLSGAKTYTFTCKAPFGVQAFPSTMIAPGTFS